MKAKKVDLLQIQFKLRVEPASPVDIGSESHCGCDTETGGSGTDISRECEQSGNENRRGT